MKINMMTIHIAPTLLVLAAASVHGLSAVETHFDGVPGTLNYGGSHRRASAYIPKFSKKSKGKGGAYVEDEDYIWVYEQKSHKKSKSKGSKGSKDSKKREKSVVSRMPTDAPIPTRPSSSDDNGTTKSHSNDSSEDCPPKRPPTPVPPPDKDPTTPTCPSNPKAVAMDTYAIDYTISQIAGTLSKADFRELQVVTENFFKNHMINEYKLSTQADLCDFTASFVTAHYTTGEPVHVQYNSTAFFDDKSSNIPLPDTLIQVLQKSNEFPKAYRDELKSELGENNPFSTTTTVTFTSPKPTPTTRSSNTSSESVFGIAGASATAIMTLAIFVGVARRRKDFSYTDDEGLNKSFETKGRCDTTIAGETFVSEFDDSTYDATLSVFTSSSFGIESNNVQQSASEDRGMESVEEHSVSRRGEDGTRASQRKPRSVAEIERMLSSWGYDGVI